MTEAFRLDLERLSFSHPRRGALDPSHPVAERVPLAAHILALGRELRLARPELREAIVRVANGRPRDGGVREGGGDIPLRVGPWTPLGLVQAGGDTE